MFTNKIVWSADVTHIGQGINGPENYLVDDQDIISLCVTTISMSVGRQMREKEVAQIC